MPYIIFTLYILGIGSALAMGFSFYEEGLTFTSILYLLGAVILLFLAWLGTHYILIGVIA